MTGRIGLNDDAVSFLSACRPVKIDVGLIGEVLQCRRAAADPDSLFAARTSLRLHIDACAELFAEG
jgi:hypothetical protein